MTVYDMAASATRMGLEGAADYEKGIAEFQKIHENLQQQGGGLVSIYYHPNEFDHTEFWDAVNWSAGANPPKEKWRVAAKRTPESRRQALDYFVRYLEFMQKMPGVLFVTGSQMAQLYADSSAAHAFTREETASLASALAGEITFQKAGGVYLSAAEATSVLLRWYARRPPESTVHSMAGVLGPARREAGQADKVVEKWAFRRACEDALDIMKRRGRLPNVFWIGSVPVTTADFVATLASEIVKETSGESLSLRKGNFTADRYAAEDSGQLFEWPIHPQGFHAPHVMELARLQCWSLKPATVGK